MVGEGFGEIFELKAEALRFDDDGLDFAFEQPGFLSLRGFRAGGNDGANAGTNLEKTGSHEASDHLVRSVGIDFEIAAESADRGEGVAGAKLSGHHGLSGGVNDLVIEFAAGLELDVEGNHGCTIARRTVLSRWLSSERWKVGKSGAESRWCLDHEERGADKNRPKGRPLQGKKNARKACHAAPSVGHAGNEAWTGVSGTCRMARREKETSK